MPKTRKRNKGRAAALQGRSEKGAGSQGVMKSYSPLADGRPAPVRPSVRRAPAARNPQGLVFPALVATGCWGMVVYFFLLTNEANHLLFGGLAVLMALLWSFSFALRVRRFLQQRSQT